MSGEMTPALSHAQLRQPIRRAWTRGAMGLAALLATPAIAQTQHAVLHFTEVK